MKNLTTQQAELHAHRRLEEGSGPIGAWPYAAWRGDEGDFDGFCVRLVLTDGATTVAPENPAFLRRVSGPATVPPELVAHIVER